MQLDEKYRKKSHLFAYRVINVSLLSPTDLDERYRKYIILSFQFNLQPQVCLFCRFVSVLFLFCFRLFPFVSILFPKKNAINVDISTLFLFCFCVSTFQSVRKTIGVYKYLHMKTINLCECILVTRYSDIHPLYRRTK